MPFSVDSVISGCYIACAAEKDSLNQPRINHLNYTPQKYK